MEKKEFKITTITNNTKEECVLIGDFDIKKQVIYYQEKDELHTKMTLDLKNKILTRENDLMLIVNSLEKNTTTVGSAFIKELNERVDLPIYTNRLEITKNKVFFEYTIVDSGETVTYELSF